jgi:serine/threonine protein phosphatase PrpC
MLAAYFIGNENLTEVMIEREGVAEIYTKTSVNETSIVSTYCDTTNESIRYKINKKQQVRCLNPMIAKVDSKLTNCIGLGSIKNIYMKKIRIRKNTSYLICSDGYYKMLDISNMAAALHSQNIASNDSINKILRTFGKKNEQMGEEDNMTAICLMFKI